MAKTKRVDIREAKGRLAELVQRAAKGEEFILEWNGVPQALLGPLSRKPLREPGHGAGEWEVSGEFNDPLPDDVLDALRGRGI